MKKFILIVLLVAGGSYYYYPAWKEFVPQKIASEVGGIVAKIDEIKAAVEGKISKLYQQEPKAVEKKPKVEKKSNVTIVSPKSSSESPAIDRAFKDRISNIQVSGSGRVKTLLSDDRQGSQHQRFILKLDSGQTLLVAHNIDLAPRIDALRVGDTVDFYGEYEWNSKGGVVHWTHRDPPGGSSHISGWLKHNSRTYQ